MAFTNSWSDIIPAGSDPANTADDEMRQTRLDVHERMDTIVGDWTADPLFVLTGIRKSLVWSDGGLLSEITSYGTDSFGIHLNVALDQLTWWTRLPLPVGAILQDVEFTVFDDVAGASVANEVFRTSYAPPARVSLGSVTSVTVPLIYQLVSVTALAHTVLIDEPILCRSLITSVVAANSARYYGLNYVYDLPHAILGAIA